MTTMNTMNNHIFSFVVAGGIALGTVFQAAQATACQSHAAVELAAAEGAVKVTGAWARPTIAKLRVTAAYFRIDGMTGKADKLMSVSTPAAARAELHQHIMEGDIAKMRHVESVPVTPGTPTVFEPAGYHVMIMGLKGPLNEGDSFPLTLTFDKAGDVTVTVTVSKKAPSGHGAVDHGKMDHGKMGHGGHKH